MTDAVECVFRSIKERLGEITLPEFREAMDKWTFLPIERDGQICGAIMQNGSEVHIAIDPDSQSKVWLRKEIKPILKSVIDEYGCATTKVATGHEIGHRLAKLLGFSPTHLQGGAVAYKCTEARI